MVHYHPKGNIYFCLNAFWEEICHIEMEDQLIALVEAM